VSDEYNIVVKKDIDEFDSMGKSLEWARKLIEDAKSTAEAPQQPQPLSDTAILERAALVEQALDDPAFDTGRYIDDDIENLRVGDLVRVYAVEEDQADLVDAAGPVVSVDGDQYSVYLDGDTFLFKRDQIELMPTGFNPHYGDKQ
jgi:hypothetical protein